jgi:hypothetical protein
MSNQEEPKQYFFYDEKFKLLKQCQQEIFESTEVSPSLRKIINELISIENLQQLKSKFTNLWRNA